MKYQIKTKLVLILVIFGSIAISLFLVSAKQSEIKIGQLTINEPSKHGSFFISANISENSFISSVLRADFSFNALFVKWNQIPGESTADFQLFVRFLNESWGSWIQVELDDDYQGKDTGKAEISSQMIATKLTDSFQYKLIMNSNEEKTNLNNLQFIYLDTTKVSKNNFHMTLQDNTDLKIISRAEWGADESWRFDNAGDNLWPEEYYTPKKFVLHHTAGEKANLDPKATVRAIYYWHARERGWGDIGYNYLIDSFGNIYEGRYGGDAIVAGHAYMRNRNTIGIAILGCYDDGLNEKNKINCNTPDQLTEAAKISLNELIAAKSREFNIDPNGQSVFHGQMLPNVISHKDVGSTTCPGNLIYGLMPETRQLAYNILMELGGYKKPLPTEAQFVRLSANELTIEETKTAEIIAEFKNTGQAVWRGYEDNYLFIGDAIIKNKLASINALKIALASDKDESQATGQTNNQVFKLLGGNVYPGETGTFKLILNPPDNSTSAKYNYTLAWKNKGYFPGTDFSVVVTKTPCTTCKQAANQAQIQPVYGASLLQSNLPNQLPAESLAPVIIQFQNTGNQTMLKENLKLHIIYAQKHISPFRNDSWYSEFALIPPNETAINPGSVANFEFKVRAPHLAAIFPHTLTLLYNDKELIKLDHIFEVTSAYAAQITGNTLPIAVKTAWRPKVQLTFKNIGTKTWTNLTLKSYDIDYTNSWFRDNSWIDNKTITRTKTKIEPGQEITFKFFIKPYWKANTYPHVYKLFDGQTEIGINGKAEFLTYTRID